MDASENPLQSPLSAGRATGEVATVVCIADGAIRAQCRRCFQQLQERQTGSSALPRYLENVFDTDTPTEAEQHLHDRLEADPTAMVILVSDLLASRASRALNARPDTSPWGVALRDRFGERLFGMVAVTDWAPRRVPDVDRVVARDFTAESLPEALARALHTLQYKALPVHAALEFPVKVRRIRAANELLEYFKLRSRVYNIMGYIDDKPEGKGADIEVDTCDLNSIHIAAFEEGEYGRQIVGTVRLISPEGAASDCGPWIWPLVQQDDKLRQSFTNAMSPLALPVWRSQRVADKIIQMYDRNERHAELSRVVVAETHRGTGLSRVLIRYAMHVAEQLGVAWLFLECVPVHRGLYEKFGFRALPGTHERVVNVDRTVIAMECQPAVALQAPPGLLPESARRIILEQDYLCACRYEDCLFGAYARYKTKPCPLSYRPLQPR